MLSLGRSFRTSKEKEMIEIGAETAYVSALVESCKREYKIDYRIDRTSKKAIKINGLPISKMTELLGIVNVVVFSPEDLSLVKDGPKERRAFIDRELSQLRPKYYNLLSQYYKVMYQRNNLLKEGQIDAVLLDVYDHQLSEVGAGIIRYRREFIEKIAPIAHKNHSKISSNKEELEVSYEKNMAADSSEHYFQLLNKYREKDIQRQTTTHGIHRDDIHIALNGIDLRSYGSQGQKRSAAISLKLSEIQLVKELKGEAPIVLLDDIFSELDSERQYMMLDSIEDAQVFVTTAEDITIPLESKKYKIKRGLIEKI